MQKQQQLIADLVLELMSLGTLPSGKRNKKLDKARKLANDLHQVLNATS